MICFNKNKIWGPWAPQKILGCPGSPWVPFGPRAGTVLEGGEDSIVLDNFLPLALISGSCQRESYLIRGSILLLANDNLSEVSRRDFGIEHSHPKSSVNPAALFSVRITVEVVCIALWRGISYCGFNDLPDQPRQSLTASWDCAGPV